MLEKDNGTIITTIKLALSNQYAIRQNIELCVFELFDFISIFPIFPIFFHQNSIALSESDLFNGLSFYNHNIKSFRNKRPR